MYILIFKWSSVNVYLYIIIFKWSSVNVMRWTNLFQAEPRPAFMRKAKTQCYYYCIPQVGAKAYSDELGWQK